MAAADGGWGSRKLWFGVFLAGMIVAAAMQINHLVYSELVFGLVSIYGIYNGSNATIKWAAMRKLGTTEAPPPSKKPKDPKRGDDGQELG